jgi:hypothetical protein
MTGVAVATSDAGDLAFESNGDRFADGGNVHGDVATHQEDR